MTALVTKATAGGASGASGADPGVFVDVAVQRLHVVEGRLRALEFRADQIGLAGRPGEIAASQVVGLVAKTEHVKIDPNGAIGGALRPVAQSC